MSETATDYAVNRQYHNSTGRFNRVDPASGSYSLANPQSLNRYAYVHNDPVNNIDLLGLFLSSCVEYSGDDGETITICYVSYDPTTRTSGGTSASGGGGYPPPSNMRKSARKLLEQFFKDNPDCEKAFNDAIAANSDFKDIWDVFDKSRVLDATGSSALWEKMSDLGFNRPPNQILNDAFTKDQAIAATATLTRTIYLGYLFFQAGIIDEKIK